MKAKEYFAKYDEQIMKQATTAEATAICDLLMELCGEAKELIFKRRARSNQAVISVIKEFNDKWNAIAVLFEQKYGKSPLIKNGYQAFWVHEMPELGPLMNKAR